MNRKRLAALVPALGIVAAAMSIVPAHADYQTYTEPLQIRKVDANDGKLIGANTTAYHTVDVGASFYGASCTRGSLDLNWNCEDLNDYAWFRDGLPENGSTFDRITEEIPMIDGDDLQEISASETVAPTGYDQIVGKATVKRSEDGTWAVVGTLPDGVTLTHSNGYAYLTWHDKKTTPILPKPVTTTTVIPGKPAVTKTVTVPAHQFVTVQLDTYNNSFSNGRKLTTEQVAKRDAARAADKKRGTLLYRQGSAGTWLWGSTVSQFKTVDLCNPPKLGSNTDMWVLGNGASPILPWGKAHNVAQTVANANCKPKITTVVVTPAVPAKTVTNVTYVCPDGKVVPTANTECHVNGSRGGMGG